MKTRTRIIGLFLTGWMLTTPSCTPESDFEQQQPSEKYEVIQEDFSFIADLEMYREVDARRSQDGFCNVEWEIQRVQRTGNGLYIRISQPKDCHIRYEIIWDGILMEYFPMRANIFVRAIGENCGAEESAEEVIKVELDEVFKNLTAEEITNTNFNVMDACSLDYFHCSDDCDTAVSS